jgi:hypothetical protein
MLSGTKILAALTAAFLLTGKLQSQEPQTAQDQPERFLVLRLTREVFDPLVDRTIDRTNHVDEMILGTRVIGTAKTAGQPKVQLLNDCERAGFLVTLTGTTTSRTTGYNSGVKVHGGAVTRFRSKKYVTFEPGEGFRSGPATTEATTQTFTNSVDPGRGGLIGRIVTRRAYDQIATQKAIDERIATDKTKRRVSQLFDEYLEGRLARLNRAVALRETLAIARGIGLEPMLSCCSTPEHVLIVLSRGQGNAADIELPSLEARPPIQFWIHTPAFGGDLLKGLAALMRAPATNRGLFDWSRDWSRDILPGNVYSMPGNVYSEVAARPAAPQVNMNVDQLDDWLVLQFGERPPITVARAPQ